MRQSEAAFVDSGAWITLAVVRNPLHHQAREQWEMLRQAGAKLHTSVPVLIETFTFLERNANRDVAIAWKDSIYKPGIVKILACELADLLHSWEYFRRSDLHQLLCSRRDQLRHHATNPHSPRVRVRPSFRRRRLSIGRVAV